MGCLCNKNKTNNKEPINNIQNQEQINQEKNNIRFTIN